MGRIRLQRMEHANKPAKPAAKAKPAKSNGALDPTAKFTWSSGKDNPFKAGSGAHQGVEILRKLSGQPVAAIRGYNRDFPDDSRTGVNIRVFAARARLFRDVARRNHQDHSGGRIVALRGSPPPHRPTGTCYAQLQGPETGWSP
jgi:hypothetical protein